MKEDFNFSEEKFADLQMLRYRLNGFENLSLQQKSLIFCLSKAAVFGRDITFDQQGKYNLTIRKVIEAIYVNADQTSRNQNDFSSLEVYLKRVWFSSGIYHHYGCEKFLPEFSEDFFREQVVRLDDSVLPLRKGQTKQQLIDELVPVMFDPTVLPKRVNQTDGEDLILTSACNFYEGVNQKEVEEFYAQKKLPQDEQPSWGLNSKLVKQNNQLIEQVWKVDGMYGSAIKQIVFWLNKALKYTENEQQKTVLQKLITYYNTGDLHDFDDYSIAWVAQQEGVVDTINGFIEVYGDPLGLKGTWEGIVEYVDEVATARTRTIANNAQWFEDHSPVDPRFRKPEVKGVSAQVICAAMLGGDEYPASAIGINLPNANWIRSTYGSKSVTIGNLTEAYTKAAHGNGFTQEFVIDESTRELIEKYGDVCDDLHTDLHECLGHGSGRLLPGTDPDALKAYGNTMEEARADLFGLYYIADHKLVELGLTPNDEAYKSQYYTYLMNGLITQLVRIKPGLNIEEAHMRNRALIAYWVLEQGNGCVEIVHRDHKTYVKINDYKQLRVLFGKLLAEVQRIKSEGDFDAARELVEKYAVKVDPVLHKEVLDRYAKLNIAPYKGFINPKMIPVYDVHRQLTDIVLDYSESFAEQNLRYSKEYGTL